MRPRTFGIDVLFCEHKVFHFQTCPSGRNKDGVMIHELSLTGLAHASEFEQAVLAMKRGGMRAHSNVSLTLVF